MQLIPKWLRDWIAQLMPRQHSSGSSAMHMGHVSGSVQQQVHQHFYAAAQPAQDAAAPTPTPAVVRPPSGATPEQKQVLTLMKPLPEPVRIRVLDFMRREFGTALVIELQPDQVYRVRRYVEVIHQQASREPIPYNIRRQ